MPKNKKKHELDEVENIQMPHEVGLTHPVQLPTPWVNAVWKLPDITRLKQKATCLENLQCMLGTSQHITVTKRSHERHSPCCQTTSHIVQNRTKTSTMLIKREIPKYPTRSSRLSCGLSGHATKRDPPLASHHLTKHLFDGSIRDVHTIVRENLSKLLFGSD